MRPEVEELLRLETEALEELGDDRAEISRLEISLGELREMSRETRERLEEIRGELEELNSRERAER